MAQTPANTLGVSYDIWRSGLTLEAFVEGSTTYQQELQQRLATVQLDVAAQSFFAELSEPTYVLVLTEDWCGDSLFNLPILARIVEAAPGLRMRIFVREQHSALAAAYARRNIVNIPVFTFFDAQFHELGTWVERPQLAHDRYTTWLAENPLVYTIRSDRTLSDEAKRIRLRPIYEQLRVQMEHWYADQLQDATIHELRHVLLKQREAQNTSIQQLP
jgi:hypothetical protein